MDLALPLPGILGLTLAISRAGAFAAASPLTRALPVPGRLAFTLAVGLGISQPALADPSTSDFVVATVTNVAVGVVLGFLTGILIQAFAVAGSVIDLSSGLNASQIFDPLTGTQNAVFARLFNTAALCLWFVMGGDRLLVSGLGASVRAIPLDGAISLGAGLARTAVDLSGLLLVSAVQLALPALAALFLTEVVFGVASRFAPQANVFALGLPSKLGAALLTVGFVIARFPSAVDGGIADAHDIVVSALKGLGA